MPATAAAPDLRPPVFLQLAGHPLRWRLLHELARSDRTVRELTGLVGEPQNLVSYHLGKLRDGRLVSARRSAADGRDAYYRAELARVGDLLAGAGGELHPGLRLAPVAGTQPQPQTATARVLFLCTGNSARSQIAEALARERSGGSVDARSAGSHPKPLHPDAVRVVRERFGIDIAGHRSKHLDELADQPFDHVITLCDRVREVCPELPGHPEAAHWSTPDPAAAGTGYAAFEQTAADLETRVAFLLAAVTAPTPTPTAQEEP